MLLLPLCAVVVILVVDFISVVCAARYDGRAAGGTPRGLRKSIGITAERKQRGVKKRGVKKRGVSNEGNA